MRNRTYADLLLDGLVVVLLLLGLLLTLVVLFTPASGSLADPLSPRSATPPWYFLPFYQVFRLLSVGWGLGALLVFFLLSFIIPLLDRSKGPRRLMVTALGLLVLLALIWLGVQTAWGGEAQENQCLVCHSEIKVDYMESQHAAFGVGCVACHGGDPTTLEMNRAHDPAHGYRGRTSRVEIPKLCASCHADPVKMKPYGLRTDQYAEYLTSQHGLRWSKGDMNIAVCTDCHTAHRILPPYEPHSSVNPENIPDTCAACHSDSSRMRPYGLPTDEAQAFERSVHGIALLKEGNTKAPSCATCHGSHGAAPPGVEDVSKVCGTCHINERLFFNAGPHKKPMDEKKISECTSCHGNHDIAPSGKLFETTCLRCHALDSKAVAEGQKLATLLVAAQQALEEAGRALNAAASQAYDVSPYRSRMIEARAYVIQALPVQHSLDLNRAEELSRRARSIAEDVRAQVHGLLGVRGLHVLGLALVWGYLILTLLVVLLYRRERRRR